MVGVRSNLIKYRPWIGPFSNAWGDENVSDDDIKNGWEEYAENLLQQNENIPERFRHWQKNLGLLEILWDTMATLELTTLLMTLLMMITEIHM
eukprot:3771306-Ditylum_brightwellii.AAC.1